MQVRMWRKGHLYAPVGGIIKWNMENSMEVPPKFKTRTTWSSNPTSGQNEITTAKIYLILVHYSFIYYSQDMGTI